MTLNQIYTKRSYQKKSIFNYFFIDVYKIMWIIKTQKYIKMVTTKDTKCAYGKQNGKQ